MNYLTLGSVLFVLIVRSFEQETEQIPLIRKCCPESQALNGPEGTCVPSNLTFKLVFYDLEVQPDKVDLIVGDNCKYGKYRLEPHIDNTDEFRVYSDGFLELPYQDVSRISPLDYCLESFTVEDESVLVLPVVCFPPPPPSQGWIKLFSIGCLTSVPFLLVVAFIYVSHDELKNNHGKVLACYSLCLAVAYLSLASVQITGEQLPTNVCVLMAYLIQFSFMSCFFWLNLLCFHTWRRMTKNMRIEKSAWKRNSDVKFLFNSLYAWGLPTIIIGLTVIIDNTPIIPSSLFKPNFGSEACWFHSHEAALPYFYGPISVILIVNIVFFLLTARYLHKDKKNERHSDVRDMADVANMVIAIRRRQVFMQSIMLFGAMGLNWVMEVLSWAIGGPPQVWLATDIINTLQGPIVFWVFVCKNSIAWKYFKGVFRLKRALRKNRRLRKDGEENLEAIV